MEYDKKKDKSKYEKRDETSHGKIELTTNSRGEIEASIEETNRIRASLGLKPLKVEEKKEERQPKKSTNERKTAEIADQISQLKKKRVANKVIGKSLGELLEEEEEDAASWVTKARVVQEDQIKRDKELAAQRALELEARDKEIEYTSAHLKGIKVAHNFENFEDIGEGVILTLKDTSILKDSNTLNEEDADLENIKISEKERLKKYLEMKKKKPVYNAYEEDSNKSVLPQYDEEKKETSGFIISNNGKIVNQGQLDEIRQKLSANKDKLATSAQITLDSSKLLASEYMTPAEESAIKIKKTSKKKKKLRKKALDELVPEEETTGVKDRGSRKESAKIKAEEEREANEKEKREKSYQKAISKAQSSINKEEEEEVNDINKEEELEISNIIKTKKLAAVNKKKETEDEILQRVQLNAKQREEQQKSNVSNNNNNSEDQSLIFTSTTEFVRAIQPIETSTPSERDKEIMEDIEEHERMLQQANKKRKQREAEQEAEIAKQSTVVVEEKRLEEKDKREDEEEEDKEEEEEEEGTTPFEVLEDHTRSGGMAAVLKMLQHKKPSDDLMWAGRRTDEKPVISADKEIKLEYKDEFGRIRTPKEEFRALSHRFHGKKPGKNKQEKRQKQYEEDMKKLQVLNESTSLVQTMQAEQEKRAAPYIVLGASIKTLTTETASGLSKLTTTKKSEASTSIHGSANTSTTTSTTTTSNEDDVTTANVIQQQQQTKGGELKGEFKEFKIEKKQKLQ